MPRLPVFAIVPARGGSKGIPRKNLRSLGGRSLLAWAIDSGRKASAVDEVFVSSDDQAILEAARSEGAVPILRPRELADDTTPMDPVIQHAVTWINERRDVDDFLVVLLQPTSPLRTSRHVDEAVSLMGRQGARAVVSVYEPAKHPLKSLIPGTDGLLTGAFSRDAPYQRRQDLPRAVSPNGAIYIFAASEFVVIGSIPREGLIGYEMTEEESLDIDTVADLARAEALMVERGGES